MILDVWSAIRTFQRETSVLPVIHPLSLLLSRFSTFYVANSIKMEGSIGPCSPCLTQCTSLNIPIAVCPGSEYLKASSPRSQRQLISLSILPEDPEQSDASRSLETHALVTTETRDNDDVGLPGSIEMNQKRNDPGPQRFPG